MSLGKSFDAANIARRQSARPDSDHGDFVEIAVS